MLNRYALQVTLVINYLLVIYAFLLPFNIHLSNTIFNFILILFLFSGNLKDKLLYALKHKVVQALFLFYIMYILWSVNSQHIDIVIWKLKEFKYLFSIIIILSILKDNFKLKILNAFIFSVFISILISYTMKFNVHLPYIKITGYGQLTPFFYTYSQYVLLILIAVNMTLYKIIENQFKSFFLKNFYYTFYILGSLLIFLLDSKIGYILFIITQILTFAHTVQTTFNKKFILSSLLIAFLGIFILFYNSHTFHTRMSNLYNETINAIMHQQYNGSTGKRFAWDIIGFKIYLEKPIIGHGTQSHIDLAIHSIENSNMTQKKKKDLLSFRNIQTPALQTLHNEYLDHLIEFGIIGLFILLNIFYSIYKEKAQTKELRLLKFLLLIVFMIYMFVNYFFVLSQLGKVFFLLISLTLVSYENYSQKQKGSLDAN